MRFNHPPLRVRQIALVTLCLAVMLLSIGGRPHGEYRLVSATSLESHRPRPLNTFRNGLLESLGCEHSRHEQAVGVRLQRMLDRLLNVSKTNTLRVRFRISAMSRA